MSEKTLDELKAEMRKDVELILSGNHPNQKADGVMFIDGYDNCINESRRGLGKLPMIDPKDVKYCAAGSKKLLVVTIVNDEVVHATIAHNRKWDSTATINFTSQHVENTPAVRAHAQAVLSRMEIKPAPSDIAVIQIPATVQQLKLFLFIPVAVGEKVEMVYAFSEEEARAIHKEKVVDPVWCDVVTEIAIPTSPSYVDYQTRFDHDGE